MFTGLVAGPLYGASAHFVEYKLRIDDVCSAVSVHATCGMWGLIAAALFATLGTTTRLTRRVGANGAWARSTAARAIRSPRP